MYENDATSGGPPNFDFLPYMAQLYLGIKLEPNYSIAGVNFAANVLIEHNICVKFLFRKNLGKQLQCSDPLGKLTQEH